MSQETNSAPVTENKMGTMPIGRLVFNMSSVSYTHLASHFAIGGKPDWFVLLLCIAFTLLWARIASVSYTHLDVYKRQGLLHAG